MENDLLSSDLLFESIANGELLEVCYESDDGYSYLSGYISCLLDGYFIMAAIESDITFGGWVVYERDTVLSITQQSSRSRASDDLAKRVVPTGFPWGAKPFKNLNQLLTLLCKSSCACEFYANSFNNVVGTLLDFDKEFLLIQAYDDEFLEPLGKTIIRRSDYGSFAFQVPSAVRLIKSVNSSD